MARMTDDAVLAICQANISGALGFLNGRLAQERLKALQYYNGEPYGNEVDGASAIVTTEVRDIVEAMMPSLMRIFMSGDRVAQFDPTGPGHEAFADQATDYANYIFTKDNDGYSILQTAFRDGLVQKVGIVKIGWEDREDITKETYRGLTDIELEQLIAPEEVEVVAHDAYPGQLMQLDPKTGLETPQPAELHDVILRKRRKVGRVGIHAVPPEEFLISRRAVTLDSAPFIGHRVKRTATELIEMGYDRKLVDSLPDTDPQEFNQERLERFRKEDEAPYIMKPALDPSVKEIWVTECYLPIDVDGDGLAELRKITVAGEPALQVLDNEEVDRQPFRAWTPIPQAHKFYGLSIADLAMDLQLTQSTVLRQVLDNMYRANNGRYAVSDAVNLEDMMTPRPGGLVRMAQGTTPEGHIMPLAPVSIGEIAMPLLEFLDARQEMRTGVTRYNQGLDANTLNKTASGINTITGFAQMRQELVARNAGEMLLAGIFKSILELICKHQQEPRIIRLRNQWVPMDPREWSDQMDVTVTVGLGNGNKDQMLGHLTMILQTQQAAMQQLGPQNPLVDLGKIYNTLEAIVNNAGLKAVDRFFKDPRNAPPSHPAANRGPDPQVIAAQGEAAAAQARGQAEMMRARAEMLTAQTEAHARLLDSANNAQSEVVKAKIAAAANVTAALIKAGAATDQNIHSILGDIFMDAMAQDATAGAQPAMPAALDDDAQAGAADAGAMPLGAPPGAPQAAPSAAPSTAALTAALTALGPQPPTSQPQGAVSPEIQALIREVGDGMRAHSFAVQQGMNNHTHALLTAMTRPRKVIRDEDGRPIGVE